MGTSRCTILSTSFRTSTWTTGRAMLAAEGRDWRAMVAEARRGMEGRGWRGMEAEVRQAIAVVVVREEGEGEARRPGRTVILAVSKFR